MTEDFKEILVKSKAKALLAKVGSLHDLEASESSTDKLNWTTAVANRIAKDEIATDIKKTISEMDKELRAGVKTYVVNMAQELRDKVKREGCDRGFPEEKLINDCTGLTSFIMIIDNNESENSGNNNQDNLEM